MPLSRSHEALRGRKVVDMTDEELIDWIDACGKMEQWTRMHRHGSLGWSGPVKSVNRRWLACAPRLRASLENGLLVGLLYEDFCRIDRSPERAT